MGYFTCYNCGYKLNANTKHTTCPKCKIAIVNYVQNHPNKKNKNGCLGCIKYFLIFFVVIVILSALFIYNNDDNNKTNDSVNTTINNKNKIAEEHNHSFKKWKITKEATYKDNGEKKRICKNCDYIEKKEYELSDNEKLDYLKNNCVEYTYEQIARDPDDYIGKYAKFTGEVIQIMEYSDETILRVDITLSKYGYYSDTIYVVYNKTNKSNGRILEDDIVTMYGVMDGMESYTSILNSEINLPKFEAYHIEIN